MAAAKKGKGKKKKITGTPDVVKFKALPDFAVLSELCRLLDTNDWVTLIETGENLVILQRYYNLIGLLDKYFGEEDQNFDYRFRLHHALLRPDANYFPFGYSYRIIQESKKIIEEKELSLNGQAHKYTEALVSSSYMFIMHVNEESKQLNTYIKTNVTNDFKDGLRAFKFELRKMLTQFRQFWTQYEEHYLEELRAMYEKAFTPLKDLMSVENSLLEAERGNDFEEKQKQEKSFVNKLNNLRRFIQGPLVVAGEEMTETSNGSISSEDTAENIIEMAEAALFYESKLDEHVVLAAKHVIRDYIELRLFLETVPQERLFGEYNKNPKLCTQIYYFIHSCAQLTPYMSMVSSFAPIIEVKSIRNQWVTRDNLLEDMSVLRVDIRKLERERKEEKKFSTKPTFIPLSRLQHLGISNPNISFGFDIVNDNSTNKIFKQNALTAT